MPEIVPWKQKPELPQVTFRSIVAGLVIGSLVLISNFQFGLQTGWVSMMSLPSALLAFAVFKSLAKHLNYPFSDVENVFVQSVAVSVGTGPLAYGFVGIIPAIEKFLTPEETGLGRAVVFSTWDLVVWSVGLGFFGIFFAIPLRRQVVVREKLPFPSGSATATLISVLHHTEINEQDNAKLVNISEEIENTTDKHYSTQKNTTSEGNNIDNDTLTANNEVLTAAATSSPLLSQPNSASDSTNNSISNSSTTNSHNLLESQSSITALKQLDAYRKNLKTLIFTFLVSATYTVVSYFIPILRSLPVFGWELSVNHLWNFQPSPAYIGQGIIMGLPSVSYMLFGAVLGWGILAPLVQHWGWTEGPIDDWKTGAQGWILWISLSVMVSDSIVSFLAIVVKSGYNYYKHSAEKRNNPAYQNFNNNNSDNNNNSEEDSHDRQFLIDPSSTSNGSSDEDERNATYHGRRPSIIEPMQLDEVTTTVKNSDNDESFEDVDEKFLVSNKVTILGILLSAGACVLAMRYLFHGVVDSHAVAFAVTLAFFLSILAVRALGETDLNPVSGIGKLSQLIIALVVTPTNPQASILLNLVAGGIAEAGAQQAGDLMQDLKTGHLLGASPKSQFVAQIIGTVWSVGLSAVMYKVYNFVYEIPNQLFRIPTAIIWIDCARLVTGNGLPEHVFEFAVVFAIIFGIIAVIKNTVPPTSKHYSKLVWLPSGVPVGVGLYNIPSFTLARFMGGLLAYFWMKYGKSNAHDKSVDMIIFSSGLVLGEGLFSIVNMFMANFNVPHF